jgi:hypothetical protein
MSDYNRNPDVVGALAELDRRIADLEVQTRSLPEFTTAARPSASTMRKVFIFNTTTNKPEFSDGTTWNALY